MSAEAVHQLYVLTITVSTDAVLTVGALGEHRFDRGTYLYVGSARRNMDARIARHLRREKPLRWHIDYLTVAPEVVSITATPVRDSPVSECDLVQALQRERGATVPVRGFGSSDCRAGCGSHLLRLGARPAHLHAR